MKISVHTSTNALLLSVFFLSSFSMMGVKSLTEDDPLLKTTQSIAAEIVAHGKSYSDLKELVQIGPRLSGSTGASKAVEWAKTKMESFGFDRVWLQPVQVPLWTRGHWERASILGTDSPTQLTVAALGNSVGTGSQGIEGEVVEVKSLQEVDSMGSLLKGKIVFYNRAMDKTLPDTFDAYSGAVDQRTYGASVAAKQGAVAVLVRSLTTLNDDDHPHAGVLSYRHGGARIPAAALSIRSANLLSELLKKNGSLKLKLELSAQRAGYVPSSNVIAEIKGSSLPDEYVVVGGHLDSWDLGDGAHDDGAGVVQAIELLRCLKVLGLKPKRSIRVVLFMTEEFGGVGADEYAKQAKEKGERHLAAIESDRGGFAPVGFTFHSSATQGDSAAFGRVQSWQKYLEVVRAAKITRGFSGVDVEPLEELGTVTFGFVPESTHYFDFHHSALDKIETVNPNELKGGAAAMAVLTYLLAEQGL